MRISKRFRVPRGMRKLRIGRGLGRVFSTGALDFLPGAGMAHRLFDSAGDPKSAKRAGRALKKGKVASAKRHAAKAKGGGNILGRLGKGAGRAASSTLKDLVGSGGNLFDLGLRGLKGAPRLGGGGGGRHRMNVGNTKALRRSMRRVEGFAKLARKTMSFVHHHKLKSTRKRAR